MAISSVFSVRFSAPGTLFYSSKWLWLFSGLLVWLPGAEAEVAFYKLSIPEAKKVAKTKNQPLLVVFYADWSGKYGKLVKNTLSDKAVSTYANQRLIPVRIDVDDFQGTRYKEQYKVSKVPTMLLFHPDGSFLAREEGYLKPEEMLYWLQDHTGKIIPKEQTVTFYVDNKVPRPDPYGHSIILTPKSGTTRAPEPPNPAAGALTTHNFSVQVGSFESYNNALKQLNAVRKEAGSEVELFIKEVTDAKGGNFKVMAGRFGSHGEAETYRRRLTSAGVKGFVRKLSGL